MQTLEIISVNLWQILISLCNLLIMFLIVKKFLYGPVKKVMTARQASIDAGYENAARAEADAEASRAAWEDKLATADATANAIVEKATVQAQHRADKIVAEAEEKADGMIRRAEENIALQEKKAEAAVRREIVDVSALLTEKMLRREIRSEDHRALIDDFIDEMGEN
ncbi:MAG: F0F1 ATP synthase subunit B [Clostridia bacterium]|nr:F0F1 ATP synthase subunit B [Clostridia bacterium]